MVRINFYGQMPSVNHKQFHRACEESPPFCIVLGAAMPV